MRSAVVAELAEQDLGQFTVADVYRGLEPAVPRGKVKYLRVCQEVRADLLQLPTGEYQQDHPPFQDWYATPIHKVSGPHGWPSYVAKGTFGLAPVETDGSAHFQAPALRELYFQVLDKHYRAVHTMRSWVSGRIRCDLPFSTLDTLLVDTRARRATSAMVVLGIAVSRVLHWKSGVSIH